LHVELEAFRSQIQSRQVDVFDLCLVITVVDVRQVEHVLQRQLQCFVGNVVPHTAVDVRRRHEGRLIDVRPAIRADAGRHRGVGGHERSAVFPEKYQP
jgi:hypothetical protein